MTTWLLAAAMAANLILLALAARLWRAQRLAEPRLANTFRDTAGRLWTIRVDVAAVRRVRDLCQVDLLALCGVGGSGDPDKPGFGAAIARLVDDPVLLVDVLYVLCKLEAERRGVSDEEFGRALAGDAIAQAVEAMLGGVIDFFPSRRQRGRLRRMARTMLQMMAKTERAIDRTLTPEATQALVLRALTPSTSATSSPGSPASIPPG